MKNIKFNNNELTILERALINFILMDDITLEEAKELKELYLKIK